MSAENKLIKMLFKMRKSPRKWDKKKKRWIRTGWISKIRESPEFITAQLQEFQKEKIKKADIWNLF